MIGVNHLLYFRSLPLQFSCGDRQVVWPKIAHHCCRKVSPWDGPSLSAGEFYGDIYIEQIVRMAGICMQPNACEHCLWLFLWYWFYVIFQLFVRLIFISNPVFLSYICQRIAVSICLIPDEVKSHFTLYLMAIFIFVTLTLMNILNWSSKNNIDLIKSLTLYDNFYYKSMI